MARAPRVYVCTSANPAANHPPARHHRRAGCPRPGPGAHPSPPSPAGARARSARRRAARGRRDTTARRSRESLRRLRLPQSWPFRARSTSRTSRPATVPARGHDRVVQREVPHLELVVALSAGAAREAAAHLLEIAGRRPRDHERQHLRLDQPPRRHDVGRSDIVRSRPAPTGARPRDPRIIAAKERPAPDLARDPPLGLEHRQRVADHRSRHPEIFGEVALGRKPAARSPPRPRRTARVSARRGPGCRRVDARWTAGAWSTAGGARPGQGSNDPAQPIVPILPAETHRIFI